ncbi:MAG: glycosyltransferase [Candidatus Bathyarchaeota archaeon]|nr:MAG: glycosyltransferase [Candidatus Bathyarchaeota archaeon]
MCEHIKILEVTPTFPPAWSYGGITNAVFELTKELSTRGHDIEVWTSDAFDLYSRVKNLDTCTVKKVAKVRYFKNLSFTLTRSLNIHVTPGILMAAKNELQNFDVVHFHGARIFQNAAVYPYVKKHGIPYLLQAHGTLLKIIAKQRLKWGYDVLFGYNMLKNASKVIALNRFEADQYVGMGVPEEKIAILPNGIDLSEYGNLPPKGSFKNKFGVADDEKIVLYVGRLHASKGLDLLAHAFKLVLETVNQVRLVVVGPDDGGYAATFSNLISELGIEEKVLLAGFVKKRDKLAAFVDSDVFVTPRFSGFPITFLESCLAGCPIVTASNELDWIHNNVGYVTEYSSGALAKAIATILIVDQINIKFQKNTKKTIKKFDISTVTQQLESVYKEACSCGCYRKEG